jgi:Cu(I)/Ag(I) efflux system membrane fusion protein
MSIMEVDADLDNPAQDKLPESAIVEGVINQINHQTRVANISRGPINKWQRGPEILDFVFADGVTIKPLQVENKIHFTFEIQNGDFVITDYVLTGLDHNQVNSHD